MKTMTEKTCIAIEGNSVDRATGKNGRGWCVDVSPTLNTQDRHAVAFVPNAIEPHGACYAVDCRNLYLNREVSATLQAKNDGGHSLNFLNPILRVNDE